MLNKVVLCDSSFATAALRRQLCDSSFATAVVRRFVFDENSPVAIKIFKIYRFICCLFLTKTVQKNHFNCSPGRAVRQQLCDGSFATAVVRRFVFDKNSPVNQPLYFFLFVFDENSPEEPLKTI
jgi:hypothetical protein